MAKKVTLKDNVTNDTLYPQTVAEQVFLENNNTVQTAIDEIADIVDTDIPHVENGVGDVAVGDENNNVIVLFQDGHVKTKHFNSSSINADNIQNSSITDDKLFSQHPVTEDSIAQDFAIVDENSNTIFDVYDGYPRTKKFDGKRIEMEIDEISKKKAFRSLSIDDLSLYGTASREEDGTISLSDGSDVARAFIDGGWQCYHYKMSAVVSCENDFSFIIGKDSLSYGAWVEVFKDSVAGVSKFNFYKNQSSFDSSSVTQTGEIGFSLVQGEKYKITVTNNITTSKKWTLSITGEYGESFELEFTDVAVHGYGSCFIASNTSCTVHSYNVSIQYYYDLSNLRLCTFGHSFVEADSLGINRQSGFANLLAENLGYTRCPNFGQGGDNLSRIEGKIRAAINLINTSQYCLVCGPENDVTSTTSVLIAAATRIVNLLEDNGITPILTTARKCIKYAGEEIRDFANPNFAEFNTWLRESGIRYADLYYTSLNPDGTLNESLYLTDGMHPTVEGHERIYERIKLDCPYLF